jgi:DnaJ-class molecular chaperone
MDYFENCKSVEEAKKHYRELLMQYHPDHAGEEGEAITKEIINQFNAFLNGFMSHSFHSYYEDKVETQRRSGNALSGNLAENHKS